MNDEKYTYHSPPAHGPLDQEWIALEEDIAALTDYFIAALEGNESKSTLRRMWKQETDIIRSRRRKSECGACTGPDPLDVLEQWCRDNWTGAIIRPYGIEKEVQTLDYERTIKKIAELRHKGRS